MEVVSGLRRRGEEAVLKGREEVKTGQRVLGWMDVGCEEIREKEEEEDGGVGRREDRGRSRGRESGGDWVESAGEDGGWRLTEG